MESMQLDQTDVKPQLQTGNIDNSSSETEAPKVTELEILPVIYEIIRRQQKGVLYKYNSSSYLFITKSIEKDPVDNAAKQKESQDCSQKVLELQKRLDSARITIRQLPGIDYSKEEQLRRLESLRKQLALKQQLIKKYKNVQF